jgi:hypothetical protein
MKINNIEIISGFKFAEIADVIFSGVFLKSQIELLDLKENIDSHIGDSEYIFVRKKKFFLHENQIIFCKTEYLQELFRILNKQCNFNNIKLITHQSDLRISKKLYLSKPKCISKWYSINVDYRSHDLIPIPIGIANFHSKNLNEEMFSGNLQINNYLIEKDNLLYLNFNPNTNFKHRKSLFSLFSNKKWVNLDQTPLDQTEYKKKLSIHNFSLAPWGNGIDTHRFWEALYSGSIPVTKKHLIYESFETIPKTLVDDYTDISKELLKNNLQNLSKNSNDFNLNELDFNYWKKLITDTKSDFEESRSEVLINQNYKLLRNVADFKHTLKSKLKIFNRLRRFLYRVAGF